MKCESSFVRTADVNLVQGLMSGEVMVQVFSVRGCDDTTAVRLQLY